MPKRCLLIDAMGTLVALRPPAPILARELQGRFGVSVSVQQAQSAIAAEIGFYRTHMLEGRNELTVQRLHARCALELRRALPRSERLQAVGERELTEALLASLRFDVFDDVAAALGAAQRLGIAVVVVSNWDASLARVLERAGLAPLLDGVVTSAQVGAAKPQPAIFEAALALAGVRASEALHVGDNVDEDYRGARAAGIDALWLDRDGRDPDNGVPTISSLADLRL